MGIAGWGYRGHWAEREAGSASNRMKNAAIILFIDVQTV